MGVYDDKTIIQPKSRIIEFECEDDEGNTTTCRGRVDSPVGMMFDTTASGSSNSQIPFRYQVWRERARLNPCCWWQTNDATESSEENLRFNRTASATPDIFSFKPVTVPSGTFQIEVENLTKTDADGNPTIEEIDDPDLNVMGGWAHEDTPSFAIDPKPDSFKVILINGAAEIPTKCTLAQAKTWNQGLDNSPPCNGAKTKCPYYTGPRFKYMEDEHLAPGQPILGQTVQEIRTYLKDWESFEDAQKEWEKSFTLPYIWAGYKDFPHAIPQTPDFSTQQTDPIMFLVKIFWDPLEKEATLSTVPSEPSATKNQDLKQITPPNFPTLIGNLGESLEPYLKITYPPTRFSSIDGTAKEFIYKSFHNFKHKMYLAGVSLSGTTVIVINKSIITNLPDFLNSEDDEISIAVGALMFKSLSSSSFLGITSTSTNANRFWEIPEGIDLKPNSLNELVVLVQAQGQWSIRVLKVRYSFYHIDILQDGFDGDMVNPSSSNLIVSLANMINTANLRFFIVNLSNSVEISNTYNVYTLDRSLSRLVRLSEGNNPPDKRFWGIFQKKTQLDGNTIQGDIRWSRFDNCQRYLIEFTNGVSAAPIAGLKYAWTVKNIAFLIGDEEGNLTSVEMEIDESVTFPRSPKGEYMAHNYIVVKPSNITRLRVPPESSVIKLDFFEFTADSTAAEDDFLQILEEHGTDILDAEYLKRGYGGESFLTLHEEMELEASPHELTLTDSTITFKSYTKYDLSYMLEVFVPGFNNNKPIGRKWFVGVGELNTSWVTEVEVRYAWSSNQYNRPFTPFLYKGGPLSDPGAPSNLYTNGEVTNYPNCGDHEINPVGFGSLWFPYDACSQPTFRLNDEVLQVDLEIPDTSPVDEKYRGPDAKYPYTISYNPTGFLNPCVWQYSIGTRYRSLAKYVGYARLRGPISKEFDPILYAQYVNFGWSFPQLGNRGRNAVRVFRSMHFREYLYITPAGPKVGLGWLPVYVHTSSTSLFEDKPRTLFENQVQKKDLVSEFLLDLDTYSGQKDLMNLSIQSSDDLTDFNVYKETLQAKRGTWEQIYRVKRIRTPDGTGTRFPTKGFYHTFTNDSIVWAFRESPVDIARGQLIEGLDIFTIYGRITGLVIDRPTDQDSIEVYDKFDRPVYLGVPENEYKLTVEDIKFNSVTAKVKEYAKIYIDPALPVYFDRITGEILSVPNDDDRSTEIQPYALTSLSTLNFDVSPYFEPIGLENNANRPVDASELDETINPGELFADKVIHYYYKDSIDSEGPTDISELAFASVGFVKSLSIKNIIPTLLPKEEFCFNYEDFSFNLKPTINYSRYPTTSILTAAQFSGIDLSAQKEKVFHCNEKAKGALMIEFASWKSNSSVSGAGQEGFTAPITVTINFKVPIELRLLRFTYNVKVSSNLDTKLKLDPSILVNIRNVSTGSSSTLFSKPEIDLSSGKSPKSIYKDVTIPINAYEGLFIDQVIINVGKRDAACDFLLSQLLVKHLRIRSVTENLMCLEPKYIPSTGYSTGNQFDEGFLSAQSSQYLNGNIPSIDVSDTLETTGICEFWQPGAASLDDTTEVATIGKIRRHWAGGFQSVDVNKWIRGISPVNTPNVFFTGQVDQMEAKQLDLIKDMIRSIGLVSNLTRLELNYFINPYDINILANKLNAPLRAFEFTLVYKLNTNNVDIGSVSSSDRYPLWQFEGFEACPPSNTRTARCTVIIGIYSVIGAAVIADIYDSEAPSLCGPTGRISNLDLITLIQAPPAGSVAGSNVGSTLTTGSQNLDSFGDVTSRDSLDLSLQIRLQKYLDKALADQKKKYNL